MKDLRLSAYSMLWICDTKDERSKTQCNTLDWKRSWHKAVLRLQATAAPHLASAMPCDTSKEYYVFALRPFILNLECIWNREHGMHTCNAYETRNVGFSNVSLLVLGTQCILHVTNAMYIARHVHTWSVADCWNRCTLPSTYTYTGSNDEDEDDDDEKHVTCCMVRHVRDTCTSTWHMRSCKRNGCTNT